MPGSHRWEVDRVPREHEIVRAEMAAGSVLFGWAEHFTAAARTPADDWRYGLILTYNLGWLRQGESAFIHSASGCTVIT